MKFLKAFLILAILTPIVIIAGLIFLPQNINWDSQKPTVEKFLKSSTGYDIKLIGELKLNVLPNPSFSIDGVTVKAFNGDKPLFTSGNISAKGSIKNFLNPRLYLEDINVSNPKLALHRDSSNIANWQPKRLKRRSRNAFLSALGGFISIGETYISNGSIVYTNDKEQQKQELKEVQISMTQATALSESQITITGKLNKDELKANIKANLNNLVVTTVNAEVSLAKNILKLKGNIVDLLIKPSYNGKIELTGNDLFELIYELSNISAEYRNIKFPVNLKASVNTTTEVVKFTEIDLKLPEEDNSKITGDLNIYLKEKKTNISLYSEGILNLNTIGLCNKNSKINDDNSAWSTTLIDLTTLAAMQSNITLDTETIICGKRDIKSLSINIKNNNGMITINNFRISKNDSSEIKVNGRLNAQKGINGAVNIKLKNFDINDITSKVEGYIIAPLTGNVTLDINGNSISNIVKSLSGNADLSTANGVIKNVELYDIEKTVSSILNKQRPSTFQESFKMKSSFKITNGTVKSNLFEVNTNEVDIIGDGKLDIFNRTINYKLKIITEDSAYKHTPIQIKGSWKAPKVSLYVDTQGLMEDTLKGKAGVLLEKLDLEKGEDALRDNVLDFLYKN